MTNPQEETYSFYLHVKEVYGKNQKKTYTAKQKKSYREDSHNFAYGKGRDPRGISEVIQTLSNELSWKKPLAQSELVLRWSSICGSETAEHSYPVNISEGVLQIRCDSTAWATQLRYMRTLILNRIAEEFPDAGIESLHFLAPEAPSWKKGLRSTPGRGPRDTYG